jgi:hypothetical protein
MWWAREECPGKASSIACIYKPADRRALSLKVISERLQTEKQFHENKESQTSEPADRCPSQK